MFGNRRRRRLTEMLSATVVVHLNDGTSLAGVLIGDYDDTIALASARLLSETAGAAVPLDGETLIPKRSVKFVQAGIQIDDTLALAAIASGAT